METAAAAHAQAERGDLGVGHVDAGRALTPHRRHVPMRQRVDQRLLDPLHQLAHADAGAAQVDQRVADDLAGAVVGHLAAAIDRHHRNVAGRQHVLHLAGLAEGEHRVVLQQPQLVRRVRRAVVGERAHRPPRRLVRLAAEAANVQRQGFGIGDSGFVGHGELAALHFFMK
ncbi:hypothetical protein RLIN73S_05283 [Rhodanobacter lindaniclasticus]